ncbi:MAG: hypothetical protein KDA95_12745, partial [Acidimicrobiales bacterium]|nr:hypothetical protein [Acidimicrobiales bacterium]
MTNVSVPRNRSELARPYIVVLAMAAVMWVVEIVDLLPSTPFDRYGIQPRELRGLTGVVLSPFL